MATTKSIVNRLLPWRFMLFFGVLFPAWAVAATLFELSQALLIGFDVAATVFLLSCVNMFGFDYARLRRVAADADANRVTMLFLSFVLTVVIFAAVIGELGRKEQLSGLDKGVVAGSLMFIWVFANAVYTLHYAHLYYSADDGGKDCAGLIFPGTKFPVMSDFAYFAFTLGVAVQTSDVQINSRHIRNVTTAHCVAGFFFNLGVLALTINVLGSS